MFASKFTAPQWHPPRILKGEFSVRLSGFILVYPASQLKSFIQAAFFLFPFKTAGRDINLST